MNASVAKSSVYTLVANVLLAASNWLLFVIIAKSYSGLELGQFVLALSFISPAFLFASFKLRTLLVVDREWQFSLNEYFFARLLANSIIAIGCLVFVFSQWPELFHVAVLVIIYRCCDSFTEFSHSYLRRLQHFKRVAALMAARSAFTMLVLIVGAWQDATLIGLLNLWALTAFMFCGIDLMLLRSTSSNNEVVSLSLGKMLNCGSFSRSFVLYGRYFTIACSLVISALFVYLPNFFLHQQMGVKSAGYFASISYFLVAGGIIVNSLSQVLTPKLAVHYQCRQLSDFNRLLKYLCLTGLVLGTLGILISWSMGAFFLALFYTPQIAQYQDVLTVLMLAAAVRYIYIFLGTALASIQRFTIQTKIYAVGLSAMAVACYLLIPEHGLLGAAYAMLIATVVEFILFALTIKSQIRFAFSQPIRVQE